MYISGDSPAVCVQVMPLLLAGISSKAGRESGSSSGNSELAFANGFRVAEPCAAANALENPDRPSNCSQRRREIIVASRWWHWPELWRQLRAVAAFPLRRFLWARRGHRRAPVDSDPR